MDERGLLDKSDDELLRELSDGISDYLHGEARDHVASTVASSGEEVDDTIAAVGYQTMSEVSKQIAEISPQLVDFDHLVPLATETIDYLVDIAKAVGAPVGDEQETRERAFIKMLEIHMAAVEDDPEQQAIAQEMLADMMDEGSFAEAERYIEEKIRKEGGDPERARMLGADMLQRPPEPDPLSQGVQQGLQGGNEYDFAPGGGLL